VSANSARDDWDAHWSEYAEAAESNPAQAYRRQLVLRLLSDGKTQPARVLDIGSGTGELIGEVLKRWPTVSALGLEMSVFGVALSQRRLPAARFRVCNLLTEPEPQGDEAGWATHAVCSEVLEHVDDPVQLLRNARAWMAPGCRLVVTVPGGPMSPFDKHIGHRRHFSPADIGEAITAAGLKPLTLEAAGFPFHNLYRVMVIARGEKLIAAARSQSGTPARAGLLERAGAAMFEPLFKLNLPSSRFGWQTVAVASEQG
jgi:SAM-dependent methyltransferase